MNTRNNNTSSYTELVHIGGIGFMFEVNKSFKHNLISPDVLAFFDGVQESEDVTEDCAFPMPKANTNLRQSIFQYIGDNWVVCSDGVFRKCKGNKFNVEYNFISKYIVCYIDESLINMHVAGIIQ